MIHKVSQLYNYRFRQTQQNSPARITSYNNSICALSKQCIHVTLIKIKGISREMVMDKLYTTHIQRYFLMCKGQRALNITIRVNCSCSCCADRDKNLSWRRRSLHLARARARRILRAARRIHVIIVDPSRSAVQPCR